MRLRKKNDQKSEIEMSSMIDIVFQLLVFFMCATSFFVAESQLNVNLPSSRSNVDSSRIAVDVVVNILSDGSIVVNGRKMDTPESKELPQLRQLLYNLSESFEDQPVIISGDWNVPHERIIDVLNACAATNIETVSFLIPEKIINEMGK
jgi:biopolymer transport protein ExbD